MGVLLGFDVRLKISGPPRNAIKQEWPLLVASLNSFMFVVTVNIFKTDQLRGGLRGHAVSVDKIFMMTSCVPMLRHGAMIRSCALLEPHNFK
jgi:hypothetical protein